MRRLLVISLVILNVLMSGTVVAEPNMERRGGNGAGELRSYVMKFQKLLAERQSQGKDVSKAVDLDNRSREAMKNHNREEALRLMNEAIAILEDMPSQKINEVVRTVEEVPPHKKSAVVRTVSLPFKYDWAVVTGVIPQFSSGGEVEEAEKMKGEIFKKTKIKAIKGKITVNVGESPVVIEPASYEANGQINRFSSPFGIHGPAFDTPESIVAVNSFWVRRAGQGGLVWEFIETGHGEFDWSRMDKSALDANRAGINSVYTVKPANKSYGAERGFLPSNMDAYLNFLMKAVERYDGDGKDDAPGSPIINYWQIENEVDSKLFWKDTPENYAKLLMKSYEGIKQANPNAKVLIAGLTSPDGFQNFYVQVFRELVRDGRAGKRYFDIFDFHWVRDLATGDYRKQTSRAGTTYEMNDLVRDIDSELKNIGYGDIPIWITEMSDHSGCPDKWPCQSETDQAVSVAKRYTLALANGISKIFWVSLTEWKEYGGKRNGYFDNVGLIYNSQVHGKSNRKLAYYTYRLLAEKMDDLERVRPVGSSEGVYVYEIQRKGGNAYILWTE